MLPLLPVLPVLEEVVRAEPYQTLRVVRKGIEVELRKEYCGISGYVVRPPHENIGEHPGRAGAVGFPEHIDARLLPYVSPAPEQLPERVPVEVRESAEDLVPFPVVPLVPVLARMYIAVGRMFFQMPVEKLSAVHAVSILTRTPPVSESAAQGIGDYFTQFIYSG